MMSSFMNSKNAMARVTIVSMHTAKSNFAENVLCMWENEIVPLFLTRCTDTIVRQPCMAVKYAYIVTMYVREHNFQQ